MTSTDKKVSTPGCTIDRVEKALRVIEGRWKLLIIHHLLVSTPRRFSDLERAIPQVTQKMLIQQLRALEADGVVRREARPVVPPHVEYSLTPFGLALEPALDALHDWARDGAPSGTGADLS
ncbi:winged helix-turn-helix transcriptional regulator [Promicromonospora sukumoe]|uniref:winged helix-turn-helix transcriptional regulator n=1 Tax=Promicromonospora sukumoe TaxID=88382 RepID=UPI00036EDF91|nr:winged helix-turn-helix transcriptional regulator [Promicromonospora sukumoe]